MLKITLKTDTTGCCDQESTRYSLAEIHVEKGTSPSVAATDSRCLAVKRAEGECSEDINVPVAVLPKNGEVLKANFITTISVEVKTVCQSFIAKEKNLKLWPEHVSKFTGIPTAIATETKSLKRKKTKPPQHDEPVHVAIPVAELAPVTEDQPSTEPDGDDDDELDPELFAIIEKQSAMIEQLIMSWA